MRRGVRRGHIEVLVVQGLGLDGPRSPALEPELLLDHKRVLQERRRDKLTDADTDTALLAARHMDEVPAYLVVVLACGANAAGKTTGQVCASTHRLRHLAPFPRSPHNGIEGGG